MRIERPASIQPMPPNARRVFKGVVFDVYQWEQKLFDGTATVFEKIKRADTVVILPVTADKRIIMLDQEQPGRPPFTSFPAGRAEEGESPDAAALRELQEETGYVPAELDLWYAIQPTSKIDWAIFVFVARGCRPEAEQKLDGGEKIAMRLMSFEEVMAAMIDIYPFHDEMAIRFLRAKHDPEKMTELKNILGLA